MNLFQLSLTTRWSSSSLSSQWRCEKHRAWAYSLKTQSAWLLSVNPRFLLATFSWGLELRWQPAAACPPEGSIKQVKLNAAVISYTCCHLPHTHSDSQRLRLEMPEEWLWIGDCFWARWSLFALIGTMQITGECWASLFFSKSSLQISISIDRFNIDDWICFNRVSCGWHTSQQIFYTSQHVSG